jgi:hypothetical protein
MLKYQVLAEWRRVVNYGTNETNFLVSVNHRVFFTTAWSTL